MKNQDPAYRDTQAGNVLFFILICIALFAALSWAVAQGFRGSGVNIASGQQSQLAASEILEYATALRQGFKTLLINGVPLETIDVSMQTKTLQNGTPSIYTNSACLTDSCKLFSPAGGAVSERQFYEYGYLFDWWQGNYTHVGGLDFLLARVEGLGTSASEFAVRIVSLNPEICKQFNIMMGIGPEPLNAEDGGAFYSIDGDVATKMAQTDMYVYGQSDSRARGKMGFCNHADNTILLVLHVR